MILVTLRYLESVSIGGKISLKAFLTNEHSPGSHINAYRIGNLVLLPRAVSSSKECSMTSNNCCMECAMVYFRFLDIFSF